MDPLLAGVVMGAAFAVLDLAVLWPDVGWPGRRARAEALAATGVVRFAAGFLLGGVLSLPLTAVDRAPRRVLAMGLAGGLWVGVVGEALRHGIVGGSA